MTNPAKKTTAKVGSRRLTEYEIRRTLSDRLESEHADDPRTLIVQELGVCEGQARIDVAVLNGAINGYEIKSPDDTLARLPQQVGFYGCIFDSVTLVYSGRKDATVEAHIPEWWGMCRAESEGQECHLIEVRVASLNPGQSAYHLAQLLWREEVLILLEERELAKGIRSKPRDVLWRKLTESVPLGELKDLVRLTLKARVGWREPLPRLPSDGEPNSAAT